MSLHRPLRHGVAVIPATLPEVRIEPFDRVWLDRPVRERSSSGRRTFDAYVRYTSNRPDTGRRTAARREPAFSWSGHPSLARIPRRPAKVTATDIVVDRDRWTREPFDAASSFVGRTSRLAGTCLPLRTGPPAT